MNDGRFSRQDMTAILVGFGLIAAVTVFFAVKSATTTEEKGLITTEATKQNQEKEFPSVSPTEARQRTLRTSNRPSILDTRSKIEYQAAHIPDSISVPADQIRSTSLPTNDLLVIAGEGSREAIAEALSEKSANFAFISDGIDGWEHIGGQIVTFGNPSSAIDASKVTLATPETFGKAIGNASIAHVILDIRNQASFQKSRIPKAKNIPLSEIERRRNELPPATNIALYGEDPIETFQAAVRLFDLGFYSVKTLNIGFSEWESKGSPVEK